MRAYQAERGGRIVRWNSKALQTGRQLGMKPADKHDKSNGINGYEGAYKCQVHGPRHA